MAWHGFPSGEFDGVFGARLERALKRFQRWTHLEVDGVAGAATKKALRRKPRRSRLPLTVPAPASLSDPFGPRQARFHTGLDFPAPIGEPVRSAAGGRVAYADFSEGGYGNLIVIRHKHSVRTFYAHLSAIEVTVGQRVKRGQQIGQVGSTGHSTGPHLHFEARLRGAAVDAARSLTRG